MKNELKNIIFMGLGAISLTGEKASQLRQELLIKGEALYKEGIVKNEELKRNIKNKIKDNITIKEVTKENVINIVNEMDEVEREELINILSRKDED